MKEYLMYGIAIFIVVSVTYAGLIMVNLIGTTNERAFCEQHHGEYVDTEHRHYCDKKEFVCNYKTKECWWID